MYETFSKYPHKKNTRHATGFSMNTKWGKVGGKVKRSARPGRQSLASSCSLVRFRAVSCDFVQPRASSCSLVRNRAISCDFVQSRAISCSLVRNRAISWSSCSVVQMRAISCEFVQSRTSSCSVVRIRAASCEFVQSRASLCSVVRVRAVSCESVQSRASSWLGTRSPAVTLSVWTEITPSLPLNISFFWSFNTGFVTTNCLRYYLSKLCWFRRGLNIPAIST
jgi:hypothetical protein